MPLDDHSALNGDSDGAILETMHVAEMYSMWFVDYASYVILERAVPALFDGLKPVQRRILHAMKLMDDGRFHKVANIIGQTMQFHPHGDAAIGDALVHLGQKDLLIDTQGNWGDVRTGDRAAAPRYIEARLSKFALDVLFHAKLTHWQRSYDGRKDEPIHLPVRFPLILAQGADGIAVGLSTKILPHNFNELIQASIDVLHGKSVSLMPDFPTGGLADFSQYNEGQKGGKVRVRARIAVVDRKTLAVRDVPYGTTTTQIMESIVRASEKGKIKIKKVVDNTAQDVEIVVDLPPGVSPEVTIDALYAFTDCEVSISPNACVIVDEKPQFLSVNEILRRSTWNTLELLRRELEILHGELLEKWHASSLEKIFIEERIYRDIEECETWEAVIAAIRDGLAPFTHLFHREISQDDIVRLTQIKIKRISKYDSFKADRALRELEGEIKQVAHHLAHLTQYAVSYFERLRQTYGARFPRKTEIRSFDNIQVAQVAHASEKLFINREEGFIGWSLKKDEFVCECSDLDDIIVFFGDGSFLVTKISDKAFVGRDIVYANVWHRGDERMIYHMVYRDGKQGANYVKRFPVTSVTRDTKYDLTRGAEHSSVQYFSANANSESEIITVTLKSKCRARKKVFDFDFADLSIKGRSAAGNILTKYPVHKIVQKSSGTSTLGGLELWYDEAVGRLNTEGRGRFLGTFEGDDLVATLSKDGSFQLTTFELTNHYDIDQLLVVEKHDPEKVYSAIHFDGGKGDFYVKRFCIEPMTPGRPYSFISSDSGSYLALLTGDAHPVVDMTVLKGRPKQEVGERQVLVDLIDVKGWKARGNRLSAFPVVRVAWSNEELQDDEPDDSGEPEPTSRLEPQEIQGDLFGEE